MVEWVVLVVILGAAPVVGLVLRRRWSRWNPTQPTSEEARAAAFRAATFRDTGGV